MPDPEITLEASAPRGDSRRPALLLCLVFAAPVLAADALPNTVSSVPQPVAPLVLRPFVGQYTAEYHSFNVGTSSLELRPDAAPGHYVYTWTITARGIFRWYANEVTQRSWFELKDGQVRPLKYHAEDGSSTVDIDFDWQSGRATGLSEKKPVDITLREGLQDIMSIQVQVMASLQRGELAKDFRIIEKDQVKDFVYTQEGSAHLRTEIGILDTIVVSNHRVGGNRILKMWFAPSLGFAPVQAERTRDGKLDFAMRLKSLKSSAK